MIRNILTLSLVIIGYTACAQETPQSAMISPTAETVSIGAEISTEGAITVAVLEEKMKDQTEMEATVRGKVVEVCQKKGCWITLENGENTMRVTFKDYAFFMPKDISGREIVISGLATVETTEVDVLKHYAEDGGKSADEIAKITEAKKELTFEAKGVILY